MPNNCTTLIQRKQNILHKILRSNSDGKLQNAVAETTAELCVAGTRKTPAYSSTARRANLFPTNYIQPPNHVYETYLPSIRDTNGHTDRQNKIQEDFHSHSKTLVTNTSPKSTGRPPSTSISSIFNALAKRSSENFMTTYNDYDETSHHHPIPPSRRSHRSHRSHKGNGIKQTILSTKQSGDSGIDIRFSSTINDTYQQQHQQRVLGMSARLGTNNPQVHLESPLVQDTNMKERTHLGQLYQRRQNNSVKTPTKQKIDKYRRRSEETTQAMHGNTPTNAALTTTTPPILSPSPLARPIPPPPPSPTAAVRRVSSDGETQTRLEVLRLSMDSNLIQTDQQTQSQSHHRTRIRVKSPYLYGNHQPVKPTTPISNPRTPSVRLRRIHGYTQPTSSANSSHHHLSNNQHSQQQNSVKQSTYASPGNLYLAFIASRHLASLEDALLECDIDHQKLLRIFTWLKGVEDHRYEQFDHDQLLNEQNQRMLDQAENLSLYSEIQHAVDDLPANTTGKPCEKIATIQFED